MTPQADTPDPDRLVMIGRVVKPHALTGEIRLWPTLDDDEAWDGLIGADLFLADGARVLPGTVRIESLRPHGSFMLASFEGVADRGAAEALCGRDLMARREQLPELEQEAFYQCDLEGLEVVDATSREAIGRVEDVVEAGGQDLLRVRRPDGRRALIPFVEPIVGRVDFEKRQIEVLPPPGLLDINDKGPR